MEVFLGTIIVLLLAALVLWRWLTGRSERWQAAFADQLAQREALLADIVADGVGLFRDGVDEKTTPEIVVGQSALWTDYFNSVLPDASTRYKLADQDRYADLCRLARREAVVRLLENARTAGFNAVCDVCVESTDMGHTLNAAQRAMVVVTATATAYCLQDAPDPQAAAANPL